MNLTRQLAMVSMLTLILPWAGCQFIKETEMALREGQQQMLSGTARAIADSLSQFPNEFLAYGDDDTPGATRLYAQPLDAAPLIDGYLDDWTVPPDTLSAMRGADGTIGYLLGNHTRYLYLYLDVRDNSMVYAQRSDALQSRFADAATLISVNEAGETTSFRFAVEAPGQINVIRSNSGKATAETRIQAVWLETATGYRIEARLPRNLLGTKIGIAVTNTRQSNDRGIRSATFSGQHPGHLVTISPFLQSVAAGYVQPGLRLIITDREGWRLALVGNTAGSTAPGSAADSGGWLRRAYTLLLEPADEETLGGPDPSGREQLAYIAEALQGQPAPRWFRSRETGRAVVSVAYPVWSGTVQTGAIVLQQGTDAILSLTNQALTRLISLTLIATVVVALVLLGYATWLSSRIRRLSNAADQALDEKQVRSELPSALAGDEIGDLSRSFSSVLTQLGDYNSYLRSLASRLSHELRTPLTIVRSSLENLEHEPISGEALSYTARAKEGVERLSTILNAMSEASRTEELIENVEPELFSLGPILETTVAAYADAWPERCFEFTDSQGENEPRHDDPPLPSRRPPHCGAMRTIGGTRPVVSVFVRHGH